MPLFFDWDPSKAAGNYRKHRVLFDEAETVFGDPRSLDRHDTAHSTDEDRWIVPGKSVRARLIVVVYTERDGIIRIVSARKANTWEMQHYEKGSL